jgi:hypothetical protein
VAFKYRARTVEQWEARANQSGSDYENFIKDEYRTYTPTSGENCIRILPPSPAWTDAPHYGMDVWVHYGVGPERASVICLFKMLEKPCPICEDRVRAERAKDEDLVRDLKPAKRVLVFIINRKDEAQGVLAWAMPYTVDRDISKVSKDRSTGTFYFIDHQEEGYDVYFDREGAQMQTKYTGVSLARRPSSISDKISDWLEDHPLPEALRWRDYSEIKRLYEGAGRGEAAGEAADAGRRDDARGRRDDSGGRREPPQREAELPSGQETAPQSERRVTQPPQQAIQRPTDRAAASPNGRDRGIQGQPLDDADLPFDKEDAKPAAQPAASDPRARADQLRARFAPRAK